MSKRRSSQTGKDAHSEEEVWEESHKKKSCHTSTSMLCSETQPVSQTKDQALKTSDQDLEKRTPAISSAFPELKWKTLSAENLNVTMCMLYSRPESDQLFSECEKCLTYNTGREAQVHLYGKWFDLPRKQVAYGDPGLTYRFSGTTVPAQPWTPFLEVIRGQVTAATGISFNFVLINRYKDGTDYISEHRDDEKDLVPRAPIASLTLGQERDFVFRHADARGKNAKRNISPVTVSLKAGTLLLMNYPTNKYWYHSLPKRKRLQGVRINMTFRQMAIKK